MEEKKNVWNILFKDHLLEDGHNSWLKHVGGSAVYSTVNLCICRSIAGHISHNNSPISLPWKRGKLCGQ
jgi:hypothetical protein